MPSQFQVSNATHEKLVMVAKIHHHPCWVIQAGFDMSLDLPIIADHEVKFNVYHRGYKIITFKVNDKGQVKHIHNHSSVIKLLSNKVFPNVNSDHPTLYFVRRHDL